MNNSEIKGLKSVGLQTVKLSDELKELIKIVGELETRLDNKLIELDLSLKKLDEKIKFIDDSLSNVING